MNFSAPSSGSSTISPRQSLESGDFASELSRAQILSALRRREAILHAASFVATCFLRGDWEGLIGEVLERLGQTTDVARVYLFENAENSMTAPLFCLRGEWCAPAVKSQKGHEFLKFCDFEAEGQKWLQTLSGGSPVIRDGRIVSGARPLSGGGIAPSMVLMPIIVAGNWWGFLGFEECRHEREWDNSEIEALQLTSDIIGAGIERGRAARDSDDARRELRAIFGAMSDVIFVIDRDGRYLKVVPTQPDLLIQPATNLQGRTVSEVIGGEVGTRLTQTITQVLSDNQMRKLEYPLFINGETKWFDASITPLDENSVVFVARDVTEAVAAREELSRNAALFHFAR